MTTSTPPDSQKIFKIIQAIRLHPVLYINDVKGVDMKLQDFRQKVWQFIADDLGIDVDWMKNRWKNLKDTYCRIAKYKHNPNKGIRRKKWIYEDQLSFLTFPFEPNYIQQTCAVTQDYFQMINNNTLTSEGLLEQLEDKHEEDYSEFLEVVQKSKPSTSQESSNKKLIETSISPLVSNKKVDKDLLVKQIESKFRKIKPKGTDVQDIQTHVLKTKVLSCTQSAIDTSINEPPKKKQKSKNIMPNDNKSNDQKSTKEVKNSVQLFIDSMAATIKNFPEDLQSDIKFNICKVIAEAESENKKESNVTKLDHLKTLPKLLLIPCHMIDKVK